MNLNEYIKLATRSESKITNIDTDDAELLQILRIAATALQLLDMYKKQIFYGKEISLNKKRDLFENLENLITDIPFNDKLGNVNPRILHSILGCSSESGELIEALLIGIETGNIDYVNIAEEMADINWYQAIFYDESSLKWSNSLDANIAKLKQRFPDKFNSTDAIERNLDAEREILESKV